jgi:uncharacterized lipoprotein YmbA
MRFQIYSLAIAFTLAGCGSTEPRGEQYFAAHLDEANEVVAECAKGTARGGECYNAEVAVSKAKAKERTRKLGEKIKQH